MRCVMVDALAQLAGGYGTCGRQGLLSGEYRCLLQDTFKKKKASLPAVVAVNHWCLPPS